MTTVSRAELICENLPETPSERSAAVREEWQQDVLHKPPPDDTSCACVITFFRNEPTTDMLLKSLASSNYRCALLWTKDNNVTEILFA